LTSWYSPPKKVPVRAKAESPSECEDEAAKTEIKPRLKILGNTVAVSLEM